jgi:uncharacterized protein (DUF433 family)
MCFLQLLPPDDSPGIFGVENEGWIREDGCRRHIMAVLSPVPLAHIHLDEYGVAWIDDTNIKVIEVALDKRAHDSNPEEMRDQYPHLTLAQIHAALAYYYDHQQALDDEIERRYREVERLREQAGESPFRKRLKALRDPQ